MQQGQGGEIRGGGLQFFTHFFSFHSVFFTGKLSLQIITNAFPQQTNFYPLCVLKDLLSCPILCPPINIPCSPSKGSRLYFCKKSLCEVDVSKHYLHYQVKKNPNLNGKKWWEKDWDKRTQVHTKHPVNSVTETENEEVIPQTFSASCPTLYMTLVESATV